LALSGGGVQPPPLNPSVASALALVDTLTDVVVSGPGDDVMVADLIDSFNNHIAAVSQHVIVRVLLRVGLASLRRVVDCGAFRVDAQTRIGACKQRKLITVSGSK